MIRSKKIDLICTVTAILMALATAAVMLGSGWISPEGTAAAYAGLLFDTGKVHQIDIVANESDWNQLLETAIVEEYIPCTVVIDGEKCSNVGIRAKGNTSLSTVAGSESDRYSFKIEFDHYQTGKTYHGLDKLCLNNNIQDNTYMKDFLTYQMMNRLGADAPLSSFVWITVNGEDWGLYTAAEGVEDSFLSRVYGGTGLLYKPDSMDAARGGRGGSSNGDILLQYTDDEVGSYQNIFDNEVLDAADTADQARLIAALKALSEGDIEHCVNIDEVLRYFAVHDFVLNEDSYTGNITHNYYLHESNGVLSMIAWDYNLAFGGMGMGMNSATEAVNAPIDSPVSSGEISSRPMVAWIFSSEAYTRQYHAVMDELITDFFDSGEFEALIDSAAEMLSPYVQKDPTAFCSYEDFETGVQTLKEFCLLRAESIKKQLTGEIPSTREDQRQDSSGFVDASHLSLSDMGSQQDGIGIGGRGSFGRELPEEIDGQMPEGMGPGGFGGQMPDGMTPPNRFDGEMPDGMTPPSGFDGEMPDGMTPPNGFDGETPNGITPPDSENGANTTPSDGTAPDRETGQISDGVFPANGENTGIGRQNFGGLKGDFGEVRPTDSGAQTWWLLGGSAVLLAAGLIFAKLFR